MTLEFGTLKHKELRQAAELAARSFGDYEYFTNWFPEKDERSRVVIAIIWSSYKTNFSRVHQLTAKSDGKIVALAELHAPDYKDPSVLSYILHGWLNVYKAAGIKRVNDWISMDAAVAKPCHDYQKTGSGIWYLSSLCTDPSMQGIGLGTKLIGYYENYIREHSGKEVVLVTNSKKNLNFYLKRGYELFDEREIEYNGNKMGSWSLKKVLSDLKSAGSAEHNVYDSDITDSINHPLPYCEASPETNDKCSSPYDKFSKVVRAASGT